MKEHPDIENLFKQPLSTEVAEHVQDCPVCRQIVTDLPILSVELADLNKIENFPVKFDEKMKVEAALRAKFIRQQLFRKSLWISAASIAAVLVLTLTIFNWQARHGKEVADVNNDGEVNVLDSFILAQKLAKNEKVEKGDLDHNGETNQNDLNLLRLAVVNLERERR